MAMSASQHGSGLIQTRTDSPDRGGFFSYHGIWAPGVRLFRSLNFAAKALIISVAFMLPTLSMMAWLVKTEHDRSYQARMDVTRQHVEGMHGALVWAHAQELAGTASREQAQKMAINLVNKARYQGTEYFWINDMTPRMVMHPIKPELDGQDLSENRDPKGQRLFVAFVDKVRSEGAGYVSYGWPKPGEKEPVPKVSYVKGFAPWGWVVGSGVYVDNVTAAVWRRGVEVGAAVALLGLLLLGIGMAISRSIILQLGGEPAYASKVARGMAE